MSNKYSLSPEKRTGKDNRIRGQYGNAKKRIIFGALYNGVHRTMHILPTPPLLLNLFPITRVG